MSVTNSEFATIVHDRLNPFYAPAYSNQPMDGELKRLLADLEPSVAIEATWSRPAQNPGTYIGVELKNHQPNRLPDVAAWLDEIVPPVPSDEINRRAANQETLHQQGIL